MLEVKNLYREYKPKKGTPVVALDHVSVKFPDTGLIFILGKSGSGKSTLLNVMGGLDKADGGDIIIKGKSSKNFKQGDFDSYRNTYLGFIFQEYNILDEFNVGQNIALAIELQGRKATSEEINKILEEVDLKGYGSRKTNELSGGQKQRVAIARALVKDPDIIFGDEPTGALDSKTGIQVFDTLKKLAENKLVIVVSHDREFAELYGDRVIELADGKIISDIEKIKVQGKKASEGVTLIDQSVIKVDKDYELTDLDMQVIKKYLNERKNQERLISLDDSINAPFKRITRIDDFGNKESFKETEEDKIVNKKEEFKAIKSKLSIKNSFKIGASSLKTKPFRLIITILLAITSFGMFGLADTMGSYNKVTSTTESTMDLNNNSVALSKEIYYKYDPDDDYISYRQVKFNENDLNALNQKYNLNFKGVYDLSNGISYISNNYKKSIDSMTADATMTSGLYLSNKNELNDLGFELIGTYPENAFEIAITKTMYDAFKKYGYRSKYDSEGIEPEYITEDVMIGKYISLYTKDQEAEFKITGIIDTHFDKSKYSELDKQQNSNTMASSINIWMLQSTFMADYQYNYHSLLFTNSETIDMFATNATNETNIEFNVGSNQYYFYRSSSDKNLKDVVKYKNGLTSLGDNQIGLSISMISNYLSNVYDLSLINIPTFDVRYYYDNNIQSYPTNYLNNVINWLKDENNLELVYDYEIKNPLDRIDGFNYDGNFKDYKESIINKVFTDDIVNQIISLNPYLNTKLMVYNYTKSSKPQIDSENLEVACIVFDSIDTVYFSDSFMNSLPIDNGKFSFVIAKNNNSYETINQIVKDTYIEPVDNMTAYKIQNAVMPAYTNINDIIETLSEVFLYVGIGFAVFASLMLFNFITISISYKKREIGILRAVGARSRDVFNIFFAESFIIAMISYAFAIALTFIVSIIINNSLVEEANLMIKLLTPGIRQILLVLAVSLGVAFISTFMPVYKIAMKRPIDAIRDR